MLRKSRRLRAEEVRLVIKTGKSLRSGPLSLKYMPYTGGYRAAVVVSKAVAKKAVDRNRIRRAMYRALAQISPKNPEMAVFFVQKVPPAPLTPAFVIDIQTLCSKRT